MILEYIRIYKAHKFMREIKLKMLLKDLINLKHTKAKLDLYIWMDKNKDSLTGILSI